MDAGYVLVGVGLAVGVAITALIVSARRDSRSSGPRSQELENKYDKELALHRAGAFAPYREEVGGHEVTCYLTAELASKRGQLAIQIHSKFGGFAIQHINKNGTFSKKGPYFVSRDSGTWQPTGRYHIVCTLVGRFAPDHYAQKGVVTERGLEIIEFDTSRYHADPNFLFNLSYADARVPRFAANTSSELSSQLLATALTILELPLRFSAEQLRHAYESKIGTRSAGPDWYSRIVKGEAPMGYEPVRWAYQVLIVNDDLLRKGTSGSDD